MSYENKICPDCGVKDTCAWIYGDGWLCLACAMIVEGDEPPPPKDDDPKDDI